MLSSLYVWVRTRWLALLFLACALPTGLGCALLTPVGAVSDEPEHIARADGLRLGQILAFVPPGGQLAGVMMNDAIFAAAVSELWQTVPPRALPAGDRRRAEAIGWSAGVQFCPTYMAQYFPILYVPAALGLLAGETFGMSPLRTVFLGRVAMLLSFLVMGFTALALARWGRALLFAVLSLPTSLHLAASFNQDGQLIGACILAVALLTRARPGAGPAWFGALSLLTIVAGAKIAYAPLLLFCLLPIAAPGLWRRVGLVLLAGVLPSVWTLYLLQGHFTAWLYPAYHPGPLWPGDRGIWLHEVIARYNIGVLLAHPAQALLLPLQTVWLDGPREGRMMLGYIGWDSTKLRGWEYPGLVAGLIAACAGGALDGRRGVPRKADAGLAVLVLAGIFLAIELSQYITFTYAGWDSIIGTQGRYFVPFLPFLLFVLPGLGRMLPVAPRWNAIVWVLPAAIMAIINIYALPAFIHHIYKMPGP